MINMVAALNVVDLLSYNKGYEDCMAFHEGKDVSRSSGAEGPIGEVRPHGSIPCSAYTLWAGTVQLESFVSGVLQTLAGEASFTASALPFAPCRTKWLSPT